MLYLNPMLYPPSTFISVTITIMLIVAVAVAHRHRHPVTRLSAQSGAFGGYGRGAVPTCSWERERAGGCSCDFGCRRACEFNCQRTRLCPTRAALKSPPLQYSCPSSEPRWHWNLKMPPSADGCASIPSSAIAVGRVTLTVETTRLRISRGGTEAVKGSVECLSARQRRLVVYFKGVHPQRLCRTHGSVGYTQARGAAAFRLWSAAWRRRGGRRREGPLRTGRRARYAYMISAPAT